jgi:2,3-dihydro-2,3-dihydroxybenzoate dehydrogenase
MASSTVNWPTAESVALVTGAARGIGLAVSRALAREGLPVAALDRDEVALRQSVATQRAEGLEVVGFPVDVSDSKAVEQAVASVESTLGPIATLVSVAGILRVGSVCEFSDRDWNDTFASNVSSAFYVCRSVAQRMVTRRAGTIVAVGSNAATVARVNMAAYAASKAALRAFIQCLGLELSEFGIRCNLVSPGSTDTDMQRAFWTDEQGAPQIIAGNSDTYRAGIPLRRMATSEDVAHAVLFLSSERARHITLHDLRVDGGATLGA